VQNSPNYRDGRFQNVHPTPQITESLWRTIFQSSSAHRKPTNEIPIVKTDLTKLNPSEDVLVWFGHSSYYFRIGGKRFLVDPVFSRAASPVSFINTVFKGTDWYKSAAIPDIDYLVITHDHWDHLDYQTIKDLKQRIGKVICPLGVGEHFVHWNFDESSILEMDWEDKITVGSDLEIYCFPARHFSGRGFRHKQSLWASFLLKSKIFTLYMGGDSGYDTHFADIGNRFGSIDLALLENGQYSHSWKFSHMQPEETLQAAKDLQAKSLLPIHNSKFTISNHSWDEPLRRISAANEKQANFRLLTPKIGEIVFLKDTAQVFGQWWQEVE
jgi:L-ascorbate metabolism protein UlaG (beta-lactamase superfamily)